MDSKNGNNNGFSIPKDQKATVLSAGLGLTENDFKDDDVPDLLAIGPGEVISPGIYLGGNSATTIRQKFFGGIARFLGIKPKNAADTKVTLARLLGSLGGLLWTYGGRNLYLKPELKALLELDVNVFSSVAHEKGCFWGILNPNAKLSFRSDNILPSEQFGDNSMPAGTEFISALLADPRWCPNLNGLSVPVAYVLVGCRVKANQHPSKDKNLYVKFGYSNVEIGISESDQDFGCLTAYPTWKQFSG